MLYQHYVVFQTVFYTLTHAYMQFSKYFPASKATDLTYIQTNYTYAAYRA